MNCLLDTDLYPPHIKRGKKKKYTKSSNVISTEIKIKLNYLFTTKKKTILFHLLHLYVI